MMMMMIGTESSHGDGALRGAVRGLPQQRREPSLVRGFQRKLPTWLQRSLH